MFTTPIRNDFDDSRYRCCCKMHVEKAAYAIAFIGALFSGIAASFYFLEGNTPYGVSSLLTLLVYFSIVYAQRKGEPNFYMPFLILNMLALLSLIFYVAFLVAMFIIMPESYKENWAKELQEQGFKFATEQELLAKIRVMLGTTIAVTTIYTALVAYFYSIIYRAYMFMREQITHGVPITHA